jgi:hypothetical protein
MSDEAAVSATAGSLSPRNTDTIAYRVMKELPRPIYPVGAVFTAWPQGILWASVSGHGIGVVTNGQLADWEASGMIVRETPLTPAQERARMQEKASEGIGVRGEGENASGATAAVPWTSPDLPPSVG